MSRLGLIGIPRPSTIFTPAIPPITPVSLTEPRLDGIVQIVFADGTMTDVFRDFTNILNRVIPLSGTGSPEGVVEGFQGQTYFDLTGTAGNIKYTKRDSSIGGDLSKGWILD